MHTTVRVIVTTDSAETAIETAKTVLEKLTENYPPFDYFSLLGRPVKTTSKKGKEQIEESWDSTVREFKRSMEGIRKAVSTMTDEQIMEEEIDGIIRHQFYRAGQYTGYTIKMYDQQGEGIRTKSWLIDVLNPAGPFRGEPKWVVSADVHF